MKFPFQKVELQTPSSYSNHTTYYVRIGNIVSIESYDELSTTVRLKDKSIAVRGNVHVIAKLIGWAR